MEKHLNTRALAELLGVTSGTIRVWRLKGSGPRYVRTGISRTKGRVLYSVSAVREWEEGRMAASTSEESAR